MTRLSWDEYGLKLAEVVAMRADCTRRQVGAVIMDSTNHGIISTGYNGLASGRPGCASEGACPRGRLSYDQVPSDVAYEETGCRAVHAEVNAIIWADVSLEGETMYITHTPCFNCSVVIEGARLARVVVPSRTRLGFVPVEFNFKGTS